MDQLGYVGEEVPKRLAYLGATSRLLARPLSAIVFAPSGSGKSELLEEEVDRTQTGEVVLVAQDSGGH